MAAAAAQAWLTKDLEAANKNRRRVPWIIVTSHYPIFLSTMQATSVYVHATATLTPSATLTSEPPRD
jgi:hypothetical protein